MNFLRRVRKATCLMFALVMIAASPGVLQAYPEGRYCINTQPPLSGVWFHDHDWVEEQCGTPATEAECDDICEACYGPTWECATVDSCYEGDGFTGICMFN
jgi:hypothetical protein